MNTKRVLSMSVLFIVLLIFTSGIPLAECAGNDSNSLDIGNILPFINSSDIASLNVSELLKTFPNITSQNISQLIDTYLPQSSKQTVLGILSLVPQIGSQNLIQLLHYFPQIEGQNVSQLSQTIPELMSNTTELMKIVQQITGEIQKFASQNETKHDAFASLQNAMNIPQLLTNALKSYTLTEASLRTLAGQLKTNNVSDTCNEHFIGILVGLNWTQPWAMEMIDAMGKPPSYMRSFSFQWLGDYQECKAVDATIYNGKQFRGQYCSVDVPFPKALVTALVPEAAGQTPSISVGVCVSDGCSTEDLRGIFSTVSGLVSGTADTYKGNIDCKTDDGTLKGGSIVVVIILTLIGFIIAVGTVYDVISVQLPARRNTSSGTKANGCVNASYTPDTKSNGHLVNGHIGNGNGHIPSSNGNIPEKEAIVMTALDVVSEPDESGIKGSYKMVAQPQLSQERSVFKRILLAFSAYSNGVKLLNTYQPKGAIGAINGIRFLSIAWVILGHTTLFFSAQPENMLPYMFKKLEQWTFYAYYSATVSVDSFFTLSGLLVGYLTLQQLKKPQGAKNMNWFMFYFHRFWRLTPPYMLVLMVLTGLWQKMGDGPLWPTSDDWVQTKYCRKNWWTNILYVNNYVRTDEPCMGWSWYLANDMMFYILSPLIIVPLYYNKLVGGAVAGVFFLATTLASGIIAKEHEYTALLLSIIGPRPKDADFMKNMYFPAHTRMGPYIIGLLAGYILYQYKDQIQNRMSKLVALIGWFLSFTIIALVIYGVYPDNNTHFLTLNQSVAYICLHRSAWAVALSWIIIACHTGFGGWINELLSWKAFVPLGRLTYCAYLVHPIVINVYYMGRERLLYMSDNEVAYLFLANLTLSFGVAFLTSLAFESPMMGLEKVIFKKEKNS